MLIYDDLSKKCHVLFKKLLLLLWKFLSYLRYVPSFKSINGSSLSRTKYDGDSFTPTPVSDYDLTPCNWVSNQNTSVEIGIIELTEPSDTLNYKPFFNSIFFNMLIAYIKFLIAYIGIFVIATKTFL